MASGSGGRGAASAQRQQGAHGPGEGEKAAAARAVRSVEEHERECWSCQHHMKRGSFACQGCEKIQPIDPSLNYFELMGM